jgi:hypothetical protein
MPDLEILTIGHPSVDPADDETNCRAAIEKCEWFERAGMKPHWPLTTGEAAKLLRKGSEFAVTALDIDDLIDRRLFAPPGTDENGKLEWTAEDVIRLSGVLEFRRQWQDTPSGHDPKKHFCQLLLEEARSNGMTDAITNGPNNPRYDLPHLLALLAVCDNREGREKLLALTRAVLEVEHSVIV